MYTLEKGLIAIVVVVIIIMVFSCYAKACARLGDNKSRRRTYTTNNRWRGGAITTGNACKSQYLPIYLYRVIFLIM